MKAEELKPCPFCGGLATAGDCYDTGWTAWCVGQRGVSGCGVSVHRKSRAQSRDEIVAWWNRRAPEKGER